MRYPGRTAMRPFRAPLLHLLLLLIWLAFAPRIASSTTPPRITTEKLPVGTVGLGYKETLTVEGTLANGGVEITIVAGELPPGLTLTGNVISGTPTEAGSFTVVFEVAGLATGEDSRSEPLDIDVSLSGFTLCLGGGSTGDKSPVRTLQVTFKDTTGTLQRKNIDLELPTDSSLDVRGDAAKSAVAQAVIKALQNALPLGKDEVSVFAFDARKCSATCKVAINVSTNAGSPFADANTTVLADPPPNFGKTKPGLPIFRTTAYELIFQLANLLAGDKLLLDCFPAP